MIGPASGGAGEEKATVIPDSSSARNRIISASLNRLVRIDRSPPLWVDRGEATAPFFGEGSTASRGLAPEV